MRDLIFRIEGKYQIDFRLGAGAFSEVYQGHDLKTGQEVALKLEHKGGEDPQLRTELETYEETSGGPGIPQAYGLLEENNFSVLALQLLGPTLNDLFAYCGGEFSLKTVLMLADQLIPTFRHLHSKGYIHRDIKPDNLLMGDGKQGNMVYVSDMGLTRPPWDGRERSVPNYRLVGSSVYACITAHFGHEQHFRDDMEALGYVLLSFLRGSLPWRDIDASTLEGNKLMLESKQLAEDRGLFDDLPDEFRKYFKHLRSLGPSDKPGYAYLRRLFCNLFKREGFEYDSVFDWTELLFLAKLEEDEKEKGRRDG